MKVRDYKDLIIWQKAIDYAVEIYSLTSRFPSDERFGLTSQLRRAAISVSSNIAEGEGRTTTRDYLNFLSHSRGSLREASSLLHLSGRLGFISTTEMTRAEGLAIEIGKMNSTMRAKLGAKL